MRVTKVLICTEDNQWVECYSEGGMNTGRIDIDTRIPDHTWVQTNKMPDTEIVATCLLACEVISKANCKLIVVKD